VLPTELMHYLFCYRSTITREKFEELCEDLWEQALTPVKEVLTHSGMKIDDIYAVELIGGATRVPKLQVNKFGCLFRLLLKLCHCSAFQNHLYIY
jgi:hypothetical protein